MRDWALSVRLALIVSWPLHAQKMITPGMYRLPCSRFPTKARFVQDAEMMRCVGLYISPIDLRYKTAPYDPKSRGVKSRSSTFHSP